MAVNRIEEFTSLLSTLKTELEIKQACIDEIGYLDSALTTASKKRALTRYRNAIKTHNPNHLALSYLRLSINESNDLKQASKAQVYLDHTNLRQIDAQTLIGKALELIQTDSYLNIALGLMLLSGRRATEILKTASFQKIAQSYVRFSGQLKTKGSTNAQTEPYNIPVLCDVDVFMQGFFKLRELRDFSELTHDQVHSRANKALNESCKRHFKGLIENPKPKDLRSAYATIAYARYAPKNWSSDAYYAQILGHSEQDLNTALSYQDFYLA